MPLSHIFINFYQSIFMCWKVDQIFTMPKIVWYYFNISAIQNALGVNQD